jgi:hypothetical protein
MLTEARYQEAIALLEAAHASAEARLSAAIDGMLKEGTAVQFDGAEALMEWLKAERPDETI